MIHGALDSRLAPISLDDVRDDLERLKGDIRLYRRRVPDLRKQCDRYTGFCPVHAESKPSFCIWVKNGILLFKCFGCGISGSIIDLEIALTGCTEATAIRRLKLEAAGLTGSVEPLLKERQEATFCATLRDVEMYEANLRIALEDGHPGLTSFIESSGLWPVVKTLRLGFSPERFFGCGDIGFSACGPSPALVIPLFYRGELLGVRFRNLNPKDISHKWMSLPGSKQDYVWLADMPLPSAGNAAYVFEGIRDTALARALGFNGVGMLSATAVPERNPSPRFLESVSMLRAAYNPIILVGDADAPGRAAKDRLARFLDIAVTLADVPIGNDLTDFYQHAGEEAVRAWLSGLAVIGQDRVYFD